MDCKISTYLSVNINGIRCRSIHLELGFAILRDLTHEWD